MINGIMNHVDNINKENSDEDNKDIIYQNDKRIFFEDRYSIFLFMVSNTFCFFTGIFFYYLMDR